MKKNYTAFTFLIVLGIMFAGNIISKDQDVSEILKKDLQKFPEITVERIFDGSFSSELNDYAKDQQFFSEQMSSVVANVNYNILQKTLNKGIYLKKDSLYELVYPVNQTNLSAFEQGVERVRRLYPNKSSVYIIPDKSMYLGENDLKLTPEAYTNLNFPVNDLYDILDDSDYYKTDLHLTNQGAYKVYEKVIKDLLGEDAIPVEFESVTDEFTGFYATTSAFLDIKDEIHRASNDILDNLEVTSLNQNGQFTTQTGVYYPSHLEQLDKYSYMLDGNKAITIIENSNITEKKELVLVKDSYSLAIAPYLAQHYSKVTMLDFRITNPAAVREYIAPDAEMLFLFGFKSFNSGRVIN